MVCLFGNVWKVIEGGFSHVQFSYHSLVMSFSFQKCLNAIWAVIMILWINIISFALVTESFCDR